MFEGVKDLLKDAIKEALADKIPYAFAFVVLLMVVSFLAGRFFR